MTENLAGRGEGLAGAIELLRDQYQAMLDGKFDGATYIGQVAGIGREAEIVIKLVIAELTAALEAAAPAGTAPRPYRALNEEAVAFVIETEGGDLYDQGRVLFSDARQAQDRADDLNSELEKESFRVAPLYRALSLSSPIERSASCPCGSTEHTPENHLAQASSEVREALDKVLPCIFRSDGSHDWACTNCQKRAELLEMLHGKR